MFQRLSLISTSGDIAHLKIDTFKLQSFFFLRTNSNPLKLLESKWEILKVPIFGNWLAKWGGTWHEI